LQVIKGDLDHLHLGDLLQWLQMGALSGRLTFSDRGRERRFDLLDGRIVFTSSSVPKERFATWLARECKLQAVSLRRVLGSSMLRRTLFTDSLLRETSLTREDLRASLSRLAERITARLMLADELSFTFDPSFPVRDLLNLDLDVQPQELLLEAARLSDEEDDPPYFRDHNPLPLSGEAFESFFCRVLSGGLDKSDPLGGEEFANLYQVLQDVSQTLSQWLALSPGLVPIPEPQAASASQIPEDGTPIQLSGKPHVAWNHMVLACSLSVGDLQPPLTLQSLEHEGHETDLWKELVENISWLRPPISRLDDLTARAASMWTRAASIAAPFLDVDPDTARLAAHLVVIPTDLVLWVLATLPIPHEGVRRVILRELAGRISSALAYKADLPAPFASVLTGKTPTPLGVCLHLARTDLPSQALWNLTVPDPEGSFADTVPDFKIQAARQALEADDA
jgi:hypothetical protein